MRVFRKPARTGIVATLSLTLILPACHRRIRKEEKKSAARSAARALMHSYREARTSRASRAAIRAGRQRDLGSSSVQAQWTGGLQARKEAFTAWLALSRKLRWRTYRRCSISGRTPLLCNGVACSVLIRTILRVRDIKSRSRLSSSSITGSGRSRDCLPPRFGKKKKRSSLWRNARRHLHRSKHLLICSSAQMAR